MGFSFHLTVWGIMRGQRETFRTVSTSVLPVGTALGAPIYDQHNMKLLGAGIVITDELLDRLRARGIHSVVVSQRDLARLYAYQPQGTAKHGMASRQNFRCAVQTRAGVMLDARIDSGHSLRAPASPTPFLEKVRRHGAKPYEPDTVTEFSQAHERAVVELEEIVDVLLKEKATNVRSLWGISSDALQRAADDMDLFVCLGINPYFSDFPTRHSVHVASVAMAVAITMELDEKSIVELGIGCLLHDIGMHLLRHGLVEESREVTDEEFVEIARHPALSVETLENELPNLPLGACLVVYQMHERCNGSGYPRGRTQDKIHDLAKIAGAVDAFVALVSPRPHRPGMQPYHAVRVLLAEVRDGLYDPAVIRALLKTISLFPIGSFVGVGEQLVGKVIRTNQTAYDRPILEVWNRGDLSSEPEILDLSRSEMPISRTLARLPQSV